MLGSIRRCAFGLLVTLSFITFAGIRASATTINVPSDQPTIQAAINAASNGDTVLVAPGTYYENINFMGKAITVTSSGGPSVTTINGGRAATVVTFDTSEGRSSVLSGFTITNGNAYTYSQTYFEGGGIYISHASPTIKGNVIKGNTSCGGGGGIAVEFSSALIQANTITDNNNDACSGGDGGGIYVHGAGSAEIIGNTISENTLSFGFGGGVALYYAGTPTVENNTISNNATGEVTPAAQGGGIYIGNDTDGLIVQNLIVNNNAGGESGPTDGQGGGISFVVSSGWTGPSLVNNTIVNNGGSGGSGVYAGGYDSQAELLNNLIIASPGQPAIYCDTVRGEIPSTVQSNDAFSSGGNGFDGGCTGLSGTNGNISADPLFLDGASNSHLQFGSPAIDAGDNNAPNLPSTDLDGNPRIVNGVVDMGVYEFAPTTISASPTSLTFGPQPVGTTSSPQGVAVTNTGNQDLLLSIGVGANFAETNNCGSAVAPGANCTIEVSFSPTTTGNITGDLTLRDNASGSPQTLALSGAGGLPIVSLTTTSLTFGPQVVGTTSAAQQVKLSNTGVVSLSISNITTTGDFAETDNCGTSVPAGGSCSISVAFTPTAAGARTGSVRIADDASDSPQTVSLTGSGLDFTLSATPSSVTVNAGKQAFYTVTATEVGGSFNDRIGFSCPYLPTGANCEFSPPHVVPGSGSASSEMTIETSKQNNDGATPSGTYTITILGISGSLTHRTTVTLVVQ